MPDPRKAEITRHSRFMQCWPSTDRNGLGWVTVRDFQLLQSYCTACLVSVFLLLYGRMADIQRALGV